MQTPFSERAVYSEYAFLIGQSLQLDSVRVFQVGEGPVEEGRCKAAQPGRPVIFFDVE